MQKLAFFSFAISIAGVIIITEAGIFGDYDSIGQSIQNIGFGGGHSRHHQASNNDRSGDDGIQNIGFGGGGSDDPSDARHSQTVGMGGAPMRAPGRGGHSHGNGKDKKGKGHCHCHGALCHCHGNGQRHTHHGNSANGHGHGGHSHTNHRSGNDDIPHKNDGLELAKRKDHNS